MKRFTFFLLTFSFSFLSCTTAITYKEEIPCANYRQAMRNFVISISNTAHEQNPSFIVVPQNGQNVAWDNEEASLDSELIYFA